MNHYKKAISADGSIQAKIEMTDDWLHAVSKKRIPFQPQGWKKEFRDTLRCELPKLKPPAENQCLVALYNSKTKSSFFDLENVLFYNIGAKPFQPLAAVRIFAQNCSKPTSDECGEETEFLHQYTYKICSIEICTDFWKSRALAVEWKPVPVSASFSKNKAIDYWRALRKNPDKIKRHCKIPEGFFGVKIKLSVPKTRGVNLPSVIKPLLDGIICAFHSADDRLQKEAGLVADRLGISKQLLLSADYDVLGACRFIYSYRGTSVKWNPQDDCCLAFEIEVEHSDDDTCRFSGKIYKLPFCQRV